MDTTNDTSTLGDGPPKKDETRIRLYSVSGDHVYELTNTASRSERVKINSRTLINPDELARLLNHAYRQGLRDQTHNLKVLNA